jgi:hypothetical protein
MKGMTNTVDGKSFDIPKVDLIQSMFRGSDDTRAELKAMWDSLPREQKKALYVQMIDQMPNPRRLEEGAPELSIEGQEIMEWMTKGNIDPARREAFNAGVTAPTAKTKADTASRTFSDVDEEIDNGASAPVEAADELPGEDPQAGRAKRPLPKDIDLRGNNLHGTDPRRATSALEDRPGFRVDKHAEIIEVPGPDGKPVEKSVVVIDGHRYIKEDVARIKKADKGLPTTGLDGQVKTFSDPDTGASRQGTPGRSAADRGEKGKQETFQEIVTRMMLGQQGSPIFREKMGRNDDVMIAYEMLRANPDSPFHADPRAAFKSPEEMAEVFYHNLEQQPILDAFSPISPTSRKRVLQGIEDENLDNRNLGLPPVSQGQAAQFASEMGMPTSRGAQRGPIEQQAIDALTQVFKQRLGGSGWGRKYDADGNLTDFGTGTPDEVSGQPGVASQVESRTPDQSADQGLWKPDENDSDELKDMVEGYRQAQYRHGVQERVGGLPRDKPGSPESSGRASSGNGEKPDNRSPEQIERDNADKQAAWEGKRERAATRFNSYTRDKDMKGVIQTRRTVDQVQADIDALYSKYEEQSLADAKTAEEMRARGEKPNIGPGRDKGYAYEPTREELAPLEEELKQAKMLQGITSPLGRKAKATKPKAGKAPKGDADIDKANEALAEEAAISDESIDPIEASATEITDPDAPKKTKWEAREERDQASDDPSIPAEEGAAPKSDAEAVAAEPAKTPETEPVAGGAEPPKEPPKAPPGKQNKGIVDTASPQKKSLIRRLVGMGAAGGLIGLAGTAAYNLFDQAFPGDPAQGGEGGGGMLDNPGEGGEGVGVANPDRPVMVAAEEEVDSMGLTSADRIRLMKGLNEWTPRNTQTAQNWSR